MKSLTWIISKDCFGYVAKVHAELIVVAAFVSQLNPACCTVFFHKWP